MVEKGIKLYIREKVSSFIKSSTLHFSTFLYRRRRLPVCGSISYLVVQHTQLDWQPTRVHGISHMLPDPPRRWRGSDAAGPRRTTSDDTMTTLHDDTMTNPPEWRDLLHFDNVSQQWNRAGLFSGLFPCDPKLCSAFLRHKMYLHAL